MKEENKLSFVEVFAGTEFEAGIRKSLLDDAGLHCFLKDEVMGTLMPWFTAPGGAGAVKLMVPETEKQQAMDLLTGIGDPSDS
ncbi:MAG TPA: DUF2007 domain-containing protein [Sediminibacterium sp.]|nr:DUF2007 domain-containing protein [Sediminibacterium sp.]